MSDVNRKFIESLPVSNWEVYTDSGYKNISHSSKTIEYDVYEVILDNNTIIKCADDHIFINKDSEQVFAKDSLNQYLITTTGLSQVLSVKSLNYKESMYDLSVDSDAHTYFTNGVLSHNTTVATIILLHYALFNKEKRIALLANKGDAAREILDRIQIAFENLPKWMQSGVVLWNKGSIEFENGSRIIAASSSSSSIRGKSMSFVYIDECVGKNSLIQVRNKNGFIFNITIGEFYNLLATENNTSDYLIKNNNYQVLTKNGFQNIDGIKKSCSKENLNIYFDDETIFTCTEYHFIEKDYMFIPVCLLNVGDYINDRKIIQIRQNKNNIEVYDLLNVANGNAYITDGINSHNCAFLDNWTDFYASVFPTLTSGEKTKMLFTSTPRGLNHFYEFWEGATKGKVDAAGNLEKNGFFPIFAPWYRVPGRGEKFKETILKGINYDYDRFRQEYECISGDSLVTIKSSTNEVCSVPISSLPTKNTEYTILTTYGFETFHGIRRTVSVNNIKFVFNDNTTITTTLNHRFVNSNDTIIASTVSIGDVLSNKVIIDIINDNTNMVMYDILETESHSYIANGINNHNCEFLGSSGSLLNATALKELIAATQEPIARNDYLTQYEQPIKDHIYFLIADVSHGKGLDYSAFSVIDVTTIPYRQICVYRNNRITPADYASVIKHVGDLYNKAYVLVESNDLGGQVTYILRVEYDYENLLSTESAGRAGKKLSAGFGNSVEDGIRTTVSTKRLGCQVLKLLLEQHKLILWDKNTIKELQTFSKSGESYEAEPGFHDDLVMGLVMFSYITQDAYFKDISNGDVVSQLRDLEEDEVTDDLVPFGIVTSAADFLEPRYVKLGNDKTAWSEHSSNPFEDYY